MTTTALVTPKHSTAPYRRRSRLWVVAGCLAAAVGLGWLGTRLSPPPFATVETTPAAMETVPLPPGLPVPVERFYRQLYGAQIPRIDSAVISGRGTMRIPQLLDLTLPVRFRFVHEAGRNYRHYIEVTLFGLPVMKVNEYFVDGKGRQELPWAVMTDNPKLDQGANLGMWAEIIQWLPAALITDPKVRWEAIDETSAFLIVPFGADEERFLVRFNPVDGTVQYWEVMRYAGGEGEKQLWINGTWFDDGKPWFVVSEENVVFNVPVQVSVDTKGP